MRLAQLSDKNCLSFRYTSVVCVEFTVLAKGVDLVEREMIRVEVSRSVRPAIFEDFIQALLDSGQFVCLPYMSFAQQSRQALLRDAPNSANGYSLQA